MPCSAVQGRHQAPVSLLDCRAAVGAASNISSGCAASHICVVLRSLLVFLQAALVQRWSQLDPGARQGVKQATLTALSSQVRTSSVQISSHLGLQHSNTPSKNSCVGRKGTCMPRQCMHATRWHFQYPDVADKTPPVAAMTLRARCSAGPNMFLSNADCRLQWQATQLLR